MQTRSRSRQSGFTLVEIMIVVAIIALLASIAVPSFLRARKRSQATAALETIRMVDSAKDQYAIENGKGPTVTPVGADLVKYVKNGTKLYTDLTSGAGDAIDNLGNAITINAIDTAPQVAAATKSDLADATGGEEFWGAYK